MKDLKHLIFFENLLLEANNELIQKAQADSKVCVAYTCENTPEPLLNLEGCFSARLIVISIFDSHAKGFVIRALFC